MFHLGPAIILSVHAQNNSSLFSVPEWKIPLEGLWRVWNQPLLPRYTRSSVILLPRLTTYCPCACTDHPIAYRTASGESQDSLQTWISVGQLCSSRLLPCWFTMYYHLKISRSTFLSLFPVVKMDLTRLPQYPQFTLL